MSWMELSEVCDFLGCNLKKYGKRIADSSSEDTIEWNGDEWSEDEDPMEIATKRVSCDCLTSL